jgi:Enoyl-CoA hydratase/isomerase
LRKPPCDARPLCRRARHRAGIMTGSATHVRIVEKTPAYWRVVFENPPFNIVDATIFEGLQNLLARMDASPSLRVVVFESANPEFYLAHFDLTGKTGNITTAVGPSGLPILMDTFVRLTKSPVVSIAKIRGCVRGVSSEFVLACDMRFASRENTLLGQPEVGVGVNPGGGGTERLPLLVGRGRARNRSRRERLRRRHRGTIRIRQPGTSGRGAGRLRRRARAPDRLLRSAPDRGGEESH